MSDIKFPPQAVTMVRRVPASLWRDREVVDDWRPQFEPLTMRLHEFLMVAWGWEAVEAAQAIGQYFNESFGSPMAHRVRAVLRASSEIRAGYRYTRGADGVRCVSVTDPLLAKDTLEELRRRFTLGEL